MKTGVMDDVIEYRGKLSEVVSIRNNEIIADVSVYSELSSIVRYDLSDGKALNSYSFVKSKVVKILTTREFIYIVRVGDGASTIVSKFNMDLNLICEYHLECVDALSIADGLILSCDGRDELYVIMINLTDVTLEKHILNSNILSSKYTVTSNNNALSNSFMHLDEIWNILSIMIRIDSEPVILLKFDRELRRLENRELNNQDRLTFDGMICYHGIGDDCVDTNKLLRLIRKYDRNLVMSERIFRMYQLYAFDCNKYKPYTFAYNKDDQTIIVREYDNALKKLGKVSIKFKINTSVKPRLITGNNLIISSRDEWYIIKYTVGSKRVVD